MRRGSDHICTGAGCTICQLQEKPLGAPTSQSDEIERLALYDAKTNLYNGRALDKKLKYELSRAKRYKRPLAIFMLSVDGFVDFRRESGELMTDSILKDIGAVLRSAVRDVDLTGAYEFNRFCVLCPETNANGATVLAERIREKIEAQQFVYNWHNVRLTISIGIASYPTHAKEVDALIARSSEALRLAGQLGGNRVCVI